MIKLKLYVEVIINSEAIDIDKPFTYEVPIELTEDIKIGQWIKVPFGPKNNLVDAFVMSFLNEEVSKFRIKKIKKIELKEPILTMDDLKVTTILYLFFIPFIIP